VSVYGIHLSKIIRQKDWYDISGLCYKAVNEKTGWRGRIFLAISLSPIPLSGLFSGSHCSVSETHSVLGNISNLIEEQLI
jgi:hypothetical protein